MPPCNVCGSNRFNKPADLCVACNEWTLRTMNPLRYEDRCHSIQITRLPWEVQEALIDAIEAWLEE